VLFPRWARRSDLRPADAGGGGARLRWLGTAGYVMEIGEVTLLIDPFVTRPGLGKLLRGLVPDEDAIRKWIPARADAVLCGHSHYDHLLDAPAIARRTGAVLAGSRSTCAFGRAAGLADDRLIEVPPEGARLTFGPVEVRFVRSLHGRVAFGRVPFPGDAPPAPRLPARAWEYRMGGAYGIFIRAPGVSIYHNGSADLIDAELGGLRADTVIVGLAGRRATPRYLERLCGALAPSLIVPTHHDAFFFPLEQGVRLLPRIDLDGFVREAARAAPRARLVVPDYQDRFSASA
jgi:L-ascorbate metabolism protein UlaG (beta-lactamase superfamily)